MQSQIPIPTDNLYKFYAMFGLLLVITAFVTDAYITKQSNQALLEFAIQIDRLELDGVDKEASILDEVYNRLIEIEAKDRNSFTIYLGILTAVGVLLMFFGFQKWHRYYQPRHDRILELTVQKLRLEAEILVGSHCVDGFPPARE